VFEKARKELKEVNENYIQRMQAIMQQALKASDDDDDKVTEPASARHQPL